MVTRVKSPQDIWDQQRQAQMAREQKSLEAFNKSFNTYKSQSKNILQQYNEQGTAIAKVMFTNIVKSKTKTSPAKPYVKEKIPEPNAWTVFRDGGWPLSFKMTDRKFGNFSTKFPELALTDTFEYKESQQERDSSPKKSATKACVSAYVLLGGKACLAWGTGTWTLKEFQYAFGAGIKGQVDYSIQEDTSGLGEKGKLYDTKKGGQPLNSKFDGTLAKINYEEKQPDNTNGIGTSFEASYMLGFVGVKAKGRAGVYSTLNGHGTGKGGYYEAEAKAVAGIGFEKGKGPGDAGLGAGLNFNIFENTVKFGDDK